MAALTLRQSLLLLLVGASVTLYVYLSSTNFQRSPAPEGGFVVKTDGRCPPPSLSIRVALTGNDMHQQLPLLAYGGIEAAVDNLAEGVAQYMERAKKGEYGEWCANGWVEISEFIAVVPGRKQTVDRDGNPYPFRVLETECDAPCHYSTYISQVRDILAKERVDVIWCQGKWSADGVQSLNVPTITVAHDSGGKTFSFGDDDLHMRHYRFVSKRQRELYVTNDKEARSSSALWQGVADEEFVLGDPAERKHYVYVSGPSWGRAKGIDQVKRLVEQFPDDEFRAYGSNDIEHELRRFAEQHPNFKWWPELKRGKDHHDVFKTAKGLLMFTQMEEAFGRVTIEALSKGTPVFGTVNGANRELITPDVGFASNNFEEVSQHLHDTFDYAHIQQLARERHHVEYEVRGMLEISRRMITRAEVVSLDS